MFVIDNILIGPFRILLLFAGVLFVHQIVTRQALKTYDLDYLVKRGVFFSSVLLLLMFVLIQLNMYDIFSLLAIFFIVLVFIYLDFKKMNKIPKRIQVKRRRFLLGFFKFMERRVSLKKLIDDNLRLFFAKKINFVLVLTFLVSISTFFSRYLFLKNDLYTLSSLWIKNLETVKSFNANVWFGSNGNLLGELAFINFYSKIAGISQEMAMHSFGLIESFALAAVLYWFVNKLTNDKYIAPMFSVLFFAFFYKFLPININLLLEHNSLYLAMCFALPSMMFTTNPKLLKRNKGKYFRMLCLIYTAIGFINFFVSLVILPIFLLVSLFFFTNKTLPYIGRSILAFVLGTSISFGINWVGCYANNSSFAEFLKSSMIQVDSYTYFPQLIMPLEGLEQLYLGITAATALLILPLFVRHRKKWTSALVILVMVMVFTSLNYLSLTWIDVDLYYQSLSVLIIAVCGIIIGSIVTYLNITVPKKSFYKASVLTFLFLAIVGVSYVTNGFFKYDFTEIDELKTDVLKVYDNLSSNNMPYSYAIVNQRYGQNISTNEHHFINYKDFLEKYSERDSVYQIKKDDKLFLQKNPDYILPESVFIFITRISNSGTQYNLETPVEVSKDILEQIQILEDKGRKVTVFYEDEFLSVYEIVNRKKSSNLNDLIFNL